MPLAVFSVSQLAPGSTVAVQLTVELPVTLTSNDPFGLPGSEPASALKIVPEGLSVMVALGVTSTVTGTVTVSTDVTTVTLL